MIKCLTIDSLYKETINFIRKEGKQTAKDFLELPDPIIIELTNPLARYFCYPNKRDIVAYTVAEAIYMFIGMNSNDLLWEFDPNWADPRQKKVYITDNNIGTLLRFYNKEDKELDYSSAYSLRSKGGFIDQIKRSIDIIKAHVKNNYPIDDIEVFLQLTPLFSNRVNPVTSAWLYGKNDKLNLLVSAGHFSISNLVKYITSFSFILQVIAELSRVELGSVQFSIGSLGNTKTDKIKKDPPLINMVGFAYKQNDLTLNDYNTLASMLYEFIARLDEKSLSRANPFERDDRLEQWSDYAEVFRAWKAEKLGYKLIKTEQNFFHPQLRYIYKGEVL